MELIPINWCVIVSQYLFIYEHFNLELNVSNFEGSSQCMDPGTLSAAQAVAGKTRNFQKSTKI